MPRGQKKCGECGTGNGPRAKRCKQCGGAFAFKAKKKDARDTKVIKINWKELNKGDTIKVRGGPYFEKNGEITPMGYSGKFVVDSLDDKGIRAFGVDGRSGFCHIYMGRDDRNHETGVWKVRHKLKRLISKK